jgi:hypothetical protein
MEMSQKDYLSIKIAEYVTSQQMVDDSFIKAINLLFDNQKVLEKRVKELEKQLKIK